ncbi:hypothetical protein QTV49_004589 [Vibrio vulnificus]|nr:hypothetical protein [Vibrio vulnificus]
MSNETNNVSHQDNPVDAPHNGTEWKNGYDPLPETELTREGCDNKLDESFSNFKLLTQHELHLNLIMSAIRRSQKWAVYLGAGGFFIVISILFATIELSVGHGGEDMARFGTTHFLIALGSLFGIGAILLILGIANTLDKNDGICAVMKYDDSVMLAVNIAKSIRLCESEEPYMPRIEYKLAIVQKFKESDTADFRSIYKSIYTRDKGDILTHKEVDSIYHIINIVIPIIKARADACYKEIVQSKLSESSKA